MNKSEKLNKLIVSVGNRFLRDGNYYLLSELHLVFKVSKEETYNFKGIIMKWFWSGNLRYGGALWSFHKQYDIGVQFKERGKSIALPHKEKITREAFRCLLLPQHHGHTDTIKPNIDDNFQFNDLTKKHYASYTEKDWGFYQSIINHELRYKETYESQNPWTPYHSDSLLYLPNLAIDIRDLKSILKKEGFSELLKYLPKRKSRPHSNKISERNEKIRIMYLSKSLDCSDTQIAKEIADKLGMKYQTVRRIINKNKKIWLSEHGS